MLKYIAETYVTLPNSDISLEQICQHAAELCPSIISNGREKRFKCEKEHAIISTTDTIAGRACTQIRYGSRSAVTEEADRFLNFGDGCAIIRPTNDGLFVRIFARNLVIFYGIRTLLEGSLSKLAAISDDTIEWFPPRRGRPRLPSHRREY
ncbi:SMa0974 family conjugal transfer regulator [Rhizobium sp. BR 315]|uniref:SMa0974 family conjugal transfer regulator n=1 Tax=Rhizobium sp. BR 315 TaxID=3040014 RepID=UPI003D34AB33